MRDTGVVFSALTERQGQLQQLIVNSNRLFETTAARDEELAETFRIFPTFLDESRVTTDRLTEFANDTNPLVTQLRPAARELSPTLISLAGLAPDLKAFFRDLDPLITVSKKGLPALEDFLNETTPLLAQVDPFLRELNPILDYLGHYKHEITAFFANDVASTQVTEVPLGSDVPVHYLRTTNPVNPEVLAAWPYRLATNRSNPYIEPRGLQQAEDRARGASTTTTARTTPWPRCRRSRRVLLPRGAAPADPGLRLRRPLERQRGAALQGAGAARAEAHGHAGHLPARGSCARALARLVT